MYKLTKENQAVIRKEDGACIPFAEGNRDYEEYLKWLTKGGVPEEYTEPPTPIPYSITQKQMRLTLLDIGIYDQVEEAINAMPGDEGKAAKITWTWAQEIRRDDPLLNQLAVAFNLSPEDVDNLFLSAASK